VQPRNAAIGVWLRREPIEAVLIVRATHTVLRNRPGVSGTMAFEGFVEFRLIER
jgi:hypothetical protein